MGGGGETTRVENRGETTRGETTKGNVFGAKWYWGETNRLWGAKRLGLKIETKRLGGKGLGETSWVLLPFERDPKYS